MNFFLKILALSVLGLQIGCAKADDSQMITPITSLINPEEGKAIALDDVLKQFVLNNDLKVLSSKTEVLDNKKTHIIKLLVISTGHIQHVKIDATTGKTLDNFK